MSIAVFSPLYGISTINPIMNSAHTFINIFVAITSLTLLLFLHMTVASAVGGRKHHLPPLPITPKAQAHVSMKTIVISSKLATNTMGSCGGKNGCKGNREGVQVLRPRRITGSRRQRSQAWKGGGALDANAHEVPSGPNPISN